MALVNFYLQKAFRRHQEEVKTSLIYLQFKYNKEKFVYTFGQTIDPNKWSKPKQRAKLNSQIATGRKEHLNDLLKNVAKLVEDAYCTKNGNVTKAELKFVLDTYLFQSVNKSSTENGFYTLVKRFLNNEILVNGKPKKPATLRSYKTTIRHLREFELVKKMKLDFNSFTHNFYNQYVTFLRNRTTYKDKINLLWQNDSKTPSTINLNDNAIGKDIKNIRTFMNEALDQDLIQSNAFNKKKIKVFNEPGEAVYLNESEILKLYKHDLSGNKKLEGVRDLFVFSCWVGLRFSDLTNIKPENIIIDNDEKYLRIKTQKTGGEVVIPTDIKIVHEIFEKYENMPNKLPKFISNVKYNVYIKVACRLAGLTEKNRIGTQPELELWQCVSSHTGRRSFATNLYLMGAPRIDIMRITGHKSESSFFRYIKVDKLEAAKRINEYYKRNASKLALLATG